MTSIVISVCHTQAEANRAIVEIADQLGIPESAVSVVRCGEFSYDRKPPGEDPVTDLVAEQVLVVAGRKD